MPYEVVTWANYLVRMNCLEDFRLGPDYRARRSTLRVTEIRCYKKTNMPGHEYLTVHIAIPHSKRSYIHIERTFADPSQPSQFINDDDVLDTARTVRRWPADIFVAQIECQDVSITLLDIALVAQLVHHHSLKYQLFKPQSYWFSDTIVGVLATFFNVSEKQLLSTRTPTGNSVVLAKDRANGRCKRTHIYERDQAMVNEIVELFRDHKEEVEEKVCLLWSDMTF